MIFGGITWFSSILQACVGGKSTEMAGFLEFWQHIFAPTSRQSAGIALKTSPIESYQFSASKLCTNFFSNSNKKKFFFKIKIIFRKKNRSKLFFGENPEIPKKNLKFSIFRFFFRFCGKFFTEKKNVRKKNENTFFESEKKIFFFGVEKKIGT